VDRLEQQLELDRIAGLTYLYSHTRISDRS
jgi:hypothetical protein